MDNTVRNEARSIRALGTIWALSRAAIYLALTPKTLTRSCSMASSSTHPSLAKGDPSYKSRVAPLASPETSQFHIIHPQVVK